MRTGRPKGYKPKEAYEWRRYHEAGVTVKRIAAMNGTSEATVYRALAVLRRKLGPEKLPNARRARWHLTARNSSLVHTMQEN